MLVDISVCLAALYLRGISRPANSPRRRWSRIVSMLRASDMECSQAAEFLRSKGFWEEALILETDGILNLSSALVKNRQVLTAVDSEYPRRWLERLGDGAPPAMWIRGTMPTQPLIGIVGSRNIPEDARDFAEEVGKQAVRLDRAVVSGGAIGCDRAGAAGALIAGGQAVEILPYGITYYDQQDRCAMSACAPDEVFSTPSAMERNALIYAASEQTVIVHARFKEGGTWIGAVEANRRKLCPLIVRQDGSAASRSLIGLGGIPIGCPSDLESALDHPPIQRGLFGIG